MSSHKRWAAMLPRGSALSTIVLVVLVSSFGGHALQAKPIEQTNHADKVAIADWNALGQVGRTQGITSLSAQDTIYFGGTVWAADSSRWEAIQDSCWTFDTGVGSHYDHSDPHVDPFKDPSLHAYMEGWVGLDHRRAPLNPYFRRLTESEFTGTSCVGASGGLQGSGSLFAGVLSQEANLLCYASGVGYGNNWDVSVEKQLGPYIGGSVTLSYHYSTETEPGFDYAYCEVDTSANGDWVDIDSFTGLQAGVGGGLLMQGSELPFTTGGNIKIRFRVGSDGAYSDEDGFFPTDCGAFSVDNVSLIGALVDHSDFESGPDGWILGEPPSSFADDWSDIVSLNDLPMAQAPCECALRDSVLVFQDSLGGHSKFKDNVAVSPWIDLKAAGLVGVPGKFIQSDMYAELSLLNRVFAQFQVQWYPRTCPNTGTATLSEWTSNGFVYYFGGLPSCGSPFIGSPTRIDFSHIIDPGAEQMRIAVGVVNRCGCCCEFFGSNSTPWYDNIKLGVYGSPDAPIIAATQTDEALDSFPQNGTLQLDAPGRVDMNDVKGSNRPEPSTSLGDTLVVRGGGQGAGGNTNTEVYIQFTAQFGPGTLQQAANTWLTSHTLEGVWDGVPWFSARMDTAEQGGVVITESKGGYAWMTAYHENDPMFSSSDRALDPGDLDPNGNVNRLLNDIFPEGQNGLLTMGTRINYFYKTRYTDAFGVPTTGVWFTFPDTTGGQYLEVEILPSSAASDSTWNCFLYVDHDNRDAQATIEGALGAVLGAGASANYEQTAWDRYDVTAPESGQASFGRPINTQYGASAVQAFAYNTILWDSGKGADFNLMDEDASVLIPWLTLGGLPTQNLYLSGDNLASSITTAAANDPSAYNLLTHWLGVSSTCSTVRDADCPAGSSVDDVACAGLVPAAGSMVGNDGLVVLQGSGCPDRRAYDVLGLAVGSAGTPQGDESYSMPIKGTVDYHSVTNEDLGTNDFKTVFDGGSLEQRRDLATCSDSQVQVEDRLSRVLNWFGYNGNEYCSDLTASLSAPTQDKTDMTLAPTLSNFSPNPLLLGGGKLSFNLAEDGHATVDIFDVNGRVVTTIFNGMAVEGLNEVSWDGRDAQGSAVASGVYFYQLRTSSGAPISRKMLVIRNGGR